MPFPWNADIVIQCLTEDLYNIFDFDTMTCGLCWLNVIAKPKMNGLIEFFGLTEINMKPISNPLLPTLGEKLSFTIPRRNRSNGTTFSFILLPTKDTNPDNDTELNKYLSPSHNVLWASLGHENILVLKPRAPIEDLHSPATTFSFPVFSTPDQLAMIHSLVDKKHHCYFEPCRTFYFCPLKSNINPIYNRDHQHCVLPNCPREFLHIQG